MLQKASLLHHSHHFCSSKTQNQPSFQELGRMNPYQLLGGVAALCPLAMPFTLLSYTVSAVSIASHKFGYAVFLVL